MSKSIEAVVGECWKALNALEFDTALSYYADDAIHRDNAVNLTMNGRPEIEQFWKAWLPVLNNEVYNFAVHNTTLTDDRFCVEWTWRARFDSDFMGMPAGKFAVPGVSVGTVENEKIVVWNDYYNVGTILVQLGVDSIPEHVKQLVPPA